MNLDINQLIAGLGFKTNLSLTILAFALILCRIIPVFVLSPLLGGETTPPELKIGTGVVLGLVMWPSVEDRLAFIPINAVTFIALLFKEIFIGMALAFVVSSIFEAARIAGTIIDTQSGAQQAQVHVPQLQEQATIFSSFNLMLSVVLFLTLNGHHLVITAIGDSFTVLPIDHFPRFGKGMWPFFDLIARVFGEMMLVGLSLAAPAMVASFVADFALGMINRVSPQLQVFFMSMAIKPLVATTLVFLSIHLILTRLQSEFVHTMKLFQDAIRLLM